MCEKCEEDKLPSVMELVVGAIIYGFIVLAVISAFSGLPS